MPELINKNPEIYRIDVPLTGNPLKNLNCYVIKDGGESAVIDTGFRTEECRQVLFDGLREIGVSPEHTKLIITHLHSDHIGLAGYFDYPDTTIYMGETEYAYYLQMMKGHIRSRIDRGYLLEGFPEEELADAMRTNPTTIYLPEATFPVTTLQDGDEIRVGNTVLTALFMPGHTPGQMIFYVKDKKIMFLADHLLFDITPNITEWPEMRNPLSQYMHNLEKLMSYDIDLALPAHRGLNYKTIEERVAEILTHHVIRLNQIVDYLKQHPLATSYEIAGGLTWSMRGRRWEDAPNRQKWFAVGETLAHISYLMEEGRIRRIEELVGGKMLRRYELTQKGKEM